MNQDKLNRFFKRVISEQTDKTYSISDESFYTLYYTGFDQFSKLEKILNTLIFKKTELDALENAIDPPSSRRVLPVIHKVIVDAPNILLWDDTEDKMDDKFNQDIMKSGNRPNRDLFTKLSYKYDGVYDVVNQALVLFTPSFTTSWIDILYEGERERFQDYQSAAIWLEDNVTI